MEPHLKQNKKESYTERHLRQTMTDQGMVKEQAFLIHHYFSITQLRREHFLTLLSPQFHSQFMFTIYFKQNTQSTPKHRAEPFSFLFFA